MSVTALDTRRAVLGGSTIAAAAGIDPWCSAVELFYRLRGDIPAQEDEPMWWGSKVEPVIFEALRERDIAAERTPNAELRDRRTPWLVGHPDGLTEDGALVEAKLTGGHRWAWGELPIAWQAQALVYMRLGGYERCIFGVCVGGVRLDVIELTYDERAADRLLDMGRAFMEYVRKDTPPPPDSSASAREALGYVFPAQTPGLGITLTAGDWAVARELIARREQRAAIDTQIRGLENYVKAVAGDAETIYSPHGTTFATWKAVTSRRIDTPKLKNEHPGMYVAYSNVTTSRRFLVHD